MALINIDEHMITTVDNPFDYFTQFDEWFQFDREHNYNTCGYLARIANVSDELSEADYALEIERAIDEIIKYDFLGIYMKVKKKVSKEEKINTQ